MNEKNPEALLLQHREIYNGKIVRLFVDDIRLESGKPAIREVVSHPGGAVAVPVLDDGRIVLIRQFRYPLGKYIWELPAGKLEPNLTPRELIAKELEEEIGYRAGCLNGECSFYTSPGFSDEVIHLFIASQLTPCERRPEDGEHITPVAHTLDDCFRMIENKEIMDGKSVLGLLWFKLYGVGI